MLWLREMTRQVHLILASIFLMLEEKVMDEEEDDFKFLSILLDIYLYLHYDFGY